MSGKARILIVDDEKMIRDGCARLLRKSGHEVALAEDGRKGLELIAGKSFDLVLLDLKMPGLGGMEVLKRIKEQNSALTVLVITGYATIETAVEAMKTGAFDFLLKPFSADGLMIAVNRALDHLRMRTEMEELRQARDRSLKYIADEQSRLRTILNSMACGVLVTDLDKTVVLSNPLAPMMLHLGLITDPGASAGRSHPPTGPGSNDGLGDGDRPGRFDGH